MNDKMKKGMIVAACVVIGIILTVLIAGNFEQPQKVDDKLVESQSTEIEVKPEIKKSELDKKSEDKKSEKEESEEKLTQGTESQPDSSTGATIEGSQDEGQPAQKIQPRVTKPETPAEEVLKNPEQRPNGESVEGAPVPENHNEVQQPETMPPGTAPEGESQDGKIYAPGFGWIDDIGEGEGIEDGAIYENGNKIGVMD